MIRKLFIIALIGLLPTLLSAQSTQMMEIYKYMEVNSGPPPTPGEDSLFVADIIKYIKDTLFLGGGEISNIQYYGNTKGVGLFRDGGHIGFSDGLILSNGYVMTTKMNNGLNKTGAQSLPDYDFLGQYYKQGGPDLPPDYYLQDDDMDYIAGYITSGELKADTALDPSIISFKFKPYYNSIKLKYVFASEEYKYLQDPAFPPVDPPVDFDLTGTPGCDFLGILVKRTPGEMGPNNVASLIGIGGPPFWRPVTVYTLSHTKVPPGYFAPNYPTDNKSFIFDGATIVMPIFPFHVDPMEITPCRNYWVKIGVADYPNKLEVGGYDLSYQMNSAVFLKAYSLMSGYGMQWAFESGVDNPEFANDSSLVEGGCSNLNVTIKFNIKPFNWDTTYILMKIVNADLSEFTITPPLVNDSVIIIYPEQIDPELKEYNMTISAIDDGIDEGTNGIEIWDIRYQMDPCDIPTLDSTGIGQYFDGYTGEIKVRVRDYNPFVNTVKIYGPDLPPPASQYHCGNDITVNITDVIQGGIPPYSFSWSNPPQINNTEQFTTTIRESPDYAYVTVFDRCTGKPGYISGKDTVVIYSKLEVEAFPSSFQLCQNGHTLIKVRNTNVGRDFTTAWYFQGNLVGNDSLYDVTWAEYGMYAPNTIDFICEVGDECGNISYDTVQASFFPVVVIQGVPLICLGDEIHLTCSPANSYQWYYNSYPGTPIPGATFADLFYTPLTPGDQTICVSIINECGEQADTCFQFFVSELICDMTMNNSTNFNTCPNVTFTLEELNAYGGWQWDWFDNGGNHTATGKNISLSLTDAGPCDVRVIAYNIDGCYDTIVRTITVYPYAFPEAATNLSSVCIGYPAVLSIAPTGPVSITDWYWTADPPDASLAGQESSPGPEVTPQVTTTYQCRITDNHGCLDSATVVVNVRPPISVQIFADPDSTCTGKPVQVDFQPVVPPLPDASYYWTFDDGVPATSTLSKPPQVIWTNHGLKTITLNITETGCEEDFSFQFQVNPDPVSAFSAANNKGCQPVSVSFTNTSSNLENPAYLWDFGDGTTETQANPSHTYTEPGHYNVTLTVTNSTGCINTFILNDAVEVYEVPVADFTADPQAATIDNPTINFTEQVNIPFALIEWDFGDSTAVSTENNPRHTYGLPGNYLVVMYTETEHGCWDRDTLEIGIVEDIKIFVPNAFSPNGDGLNDCFSIGGTTGDIIDVFRVIIFNRWGAQVYESHITTPECVWDGKDQHGNPVTADTYVFRIFGQNMRGAKKVYEGMVMVVK
jgi:gliding motility-associated-like protein